MDYDVAERKKAAAELQTKTLAEHASLEEKREDHEHEENLRKLAFEEEHETEEMEKKTKHEVGIMQRDATHQVHLMKDKAMHEYKKGAQWDADYHKLSLEGTFELKKLKDKDAKDIE